MAITADKLASRCLEIEKLVLSGDLVDAHRFYPDLVADWTRLRAAIDSFEKSAHDRPT